MHTLGREKESRTGPRAMMSYEYTHNITTYRHLRLPSAIHRAPYHHPRGRYPPLLAAGTSAPPRPHVLTRCYLHYPTRDMTHPSAIFCYATSATWGAALTSFLDRFLLDQPGSFCGCTTTGRVGATVSLLPRLNFEFPFDIIFSTLFLPLDIRPVRPGVGGREGGGVLNTHIAKGGAALGAIALVLLFNQFYGLQRRHPPSPGHSQGCSPQWVIRMHASSSRAAQYAGQGVDKDGGGYGLRW